MVIVCVTVCGVGELC